MRMSVKDAAQRLNVTDTAIRQRIARGKIKSEKIDGHVFVYLDDDEIEHTPLIASLQSEVQHLRSQLEAANNRDSEQRRIIAALTSRIPELPQSTTQDASQNKPPDNTDKTPRRSFIRRLLG